MRLFELSAEVRALEQFMDDEDIDRESFDAALKGLQIERDAKIANIGLIVKEYRADVLARKEAIKVLQDRNKSDEKRISWLIEYVLNNIDGKVKTPLVSIGKQKGRERLVVDDDAQLPDTYYRREVNKAALKEDVAKGAEFHGVRLERGPDFVVIR